MNAADEHSTNLLLNDEQVENAALYVIGWRNWPPDALESVKNEIRSHLASSVVARGIAGAALMSKRPKEGVKP